MDAQVRGGRNPTGLKDAGDFSPAAPRALSCSDPAVYRIPVPAFFPFESVALSHAHAAGISARFGSFAPTGLYARTPFSPTAAPFPVTIILSPTRTDTQKRHWQQPLVTGYIREILRGLEVVPNCGYTEEQFCICGLVCPVTIKQFPSGNLRSNRLPGGFRYSARDCLLEKKEKGSQEKKIL